MSSVPKTMEVESEGGSGGGAVLDSKRIPQLRGFLVKNLTTVLDYWDIRDGIVFLKDGSASFGIEIYPQPDAYLSLEDKEAIAEAFEGVIGLLPEGSRLRYYYEAQKATLDTVRSYLQIKRNDDPVVQRMVRERAKLQIRAAARGERLRWIARLDVYVPTVVAPATGNVLRDFFYQFSRLLGSRKAPVPFTPFYESELEVAIAQVENLRQSIIAQLRAAGLAVAPMGDTAVFTTIYRWLNRDPQRTLLFQPLNEFYTREELRRRRDIDPPTLRRQLAKTPLWATAMDTLYKKHLGTPIGEGEEHVAIYELVQPPSRSFFGAIGEVVEEIATLAPSPMSVVIDIYKPPQSDLKFALSRTFTRKFRESRSGDAPEASSLTQEGVLLQALMRAEEGEQFVTFSLSVVLRADTKEELDRKTKYLDGALSAPPFGGQLRRLRENLFWPYMNLMPFMGRRQDSRSLTMSKAVSRFLANPGPWNREGEEPRPTVLLSNRFAGIASIDLFEKRARSWNMVLVGTTGAGKTFTAQFLLSEAIATDPETEIIIVDKKGDYASWVELMGGRIIDIRPESGISLNMFDLDQTFYRERPVVPSEAKLAFLQKMFHILLNKPNDPNLALKEQLWLEAVRVAYAANTDVVYDPVTGRESGYVVRPPTLSQVIYAIQSLDSIGKSGSLTAEQKVIARQLATELFSWTSGPMASFLDAPTSLKGENSQIVYFNLSGIDQMESSLYMTLALALIADRIYGRLEKAPRNVKKFVVFDEAHALFKVKEAAALVVDLYRRARSYGAAVWTLTQTISEYRGAYVGGILETTNVFAFVNSRGQAKDIHEILRVPLSVAESATRLAMRRGVYNELLYILYDQGGGVSGDIFRIYPTSWDYWLFTSHHEEVAKRKQLVERFGGDLYRAVSELAGIDLEEDRMVDLVLEGRIRADELEAVLKRKR